MKKYTADCRRLLSLQMNCSVTKIQVTHCYIGTTKVIAQQFVLKQYKQTAAGWEASLTWQHLVLF